MAYSERVFNVGFLEIAVIAVLGLLFFGPEKLPKAVQTLVLGIRSLKGLANQATDSLQGAAGIDSATAKKTMEDLADLHPKRWAASLLSDDSDASASAKAASTASTNASATAALNPGPEASDPAAGLPDGGDTASTKTAARSASAKSGSEGAGSSDDVVDLSAGQRSVQSPAHDGVVAADLDPDLP